MSTMGRSRALRRPAATLTIAAALLGWPLGLSGSAAAGGVAPRANVGAVHDDSSTAAIGAAASGASIAASPTDAHIKLTLRASGLSNPVFVTTAHDGSGRLFIVEKTGRIKIYSNGHVLATPFLNLSGKVSTGSEQGLLGLAFHPNFKTNRKLYVNYTRADGDTIVQEYRASTSNRNVVATSTARLILHVVQPYANHNGGMIAFGPDGYLYIGMGDGGGAGDPGGRAQSTRSLLGKMLRIDVNGSSALGNYRIPPGNPFVGRAGYDEIWQLGLRNPWRWSFDPPTGELWIGDVGQDSWEEVDHALRNASGAGKGVNWGWNVLEGRACYPPSTSSCSKTGKSMPVAVYGHSGSRCAVTGGYVYRGSAIPVLRGGYVFADYCSGEIWVIAANAVGPATPTRLQDTSLLISSFGLDGNNELMLTDLQGRLYSIQQG